MVLPVTDSAGVAQCRVPAEDAGAEGEVHDIPIGGFRPSRHGRDRSRPGVDLFRLPAPRYVRGRSGAKARVAEDFRVNPYPSLVWIYVV